MEIETKTKAGRAMGTEGESACLPKGCVTVDGPSVLAIRYMQTYAITKGEAMLILPASCNPANVLFGVNYLCLLL